MLRWAQGPDGETLGVGSEQIAVTRSADGWTITGSGRLGAPLDLVTRRLQVRYDSNWKPIELTIDATARGQVRLRALGGPATGRYEPRHPAHSVLHQIVVEHFETSRARAASLRDGEGLPRFVEQELRDFLTCGFLASGFARFHCDNCGQDRLVPFSCKGRGFCPSCGARRMAERAAHLVDHVFPGVPVRQWVLSLPYRLRYLLAWDHDLCRASLRLRRASEVSRAAASGGGAPRAVRIVAVYVRAVLGFLRQRARRDGVTDGHSGAVAIIQRFGGALNLGSPASKLVIPGNPVG